MSMKRMMTLLLSALMLLSLLSGCGNTAAKSTEFDEENIVLQFGAVSDIHVGRGGVGIYTDLWTKQAYKTLRDIALEYSDAGLNAVLVSGDLTNSGTEGQVEKFAELYADVFDPTEVPLIFSLGNHDVNTGSSYNKADLGFEEFYAAMGAEYRQYEKDSRLDIGCVHQIVNGYHFIAINPLDEGYRNSLANSAMYAKETKEWLDKTLKKITQKNPDQYVFLSTSYNKADLGFEEFYAAMGAEYRQYEKDSRLDIGCVHQIVNGYHFIAINPLDEGYRNSLANSAMYAKETKEWLDKTLKKITRKNPDQYVFLSTHPIMYGMAYGGEHTYTTTAWFTRELNEILKKYPQAMIFGGHVHFSINSDTSIMQDGFTSLQCGSVN